MRHLGFVPALTAAAMLSALAAPAIAAEKPVAYTTFYPTQYFAQRIAGDLVEVVNPVPEDVDAIFWEPSRDDLMAYQQADVIILNGAGFAKWVANATLPEDKIIDTAAPFSDSFILFQNAVTHSHGGEGMHTHAGLDGHTWVDPVNAKIQAEEIEKGLAERYPEHAAEFEAGFAKLSADLDSLDATLREYQAGEKADTPIFTSHPAYNYIARRYGWNQIPLDLDPEEMPSDEIFAQIKTMQQTHPAKFLVWEGEPLPEIAERFETELGIESIVFGPAELVAASDLAAGDDYMAIMRRNIEALAKIYKPDTV
jgi:zinc transport system substrate-binding protein